MTGAQYSAHDGAPVITTIFQGAGSGRGVISADTRPAQTAAGFEAEAPDHVVGDSRWSRDGVPCGRAR